MSKKQWIKLDNAAKLFPAAVKGSNSQVFRLACELEFPVDPAILQQALHEAITVFPVYQHVLKRGFFWYYLEKTELLPVVAEEYRPPCSQLYGKTKRKLLYEVSYYQNRINLEVFHVLSDGTGALQLLSTLVTKYLSRVQGIPEPALPYNGSHTQMSDDSFSKYYLDTKREKNRSQRDACKLTGIRYSENRLKVITGTMPLEVLKKTAKEYNSTITAFLCACLMNAISDTVSLRQRQKPIIISVPVNLRAVFPSSSLRNFFSVINVEYDYSVGSGELTDVVAKVSRDLKEKLTPERLSSVLNRFSAMEHNPFARIVPLPLKNIVMRTMYALSRRKVTASLSNIGVFTIPPELKHLRSLDVMSGTDCQSVCVCSFRNRLSVSFTSPFVSADIQQRFFRALSGMGIAVEITANELEEE